MLRCFALHCVASRRDLNITTLHLYHTSPNKVSEDLLSISHRYIASTSPGICMASSLLSVSPASARVAACPADMSPNKVSEHVLSYSFG